MGRGLFKKLAKDKGKIHIIDPTNLSEDYAKFLKKFLDGDDEPELYLKNVCNTFKRVKFQLTHELSWRLGIDEESDCYEVMKDTRAGIGSFAVVDDVEGKLITSKKTLVFIASEVKPHKTRVRKTMLSKETNLKSNGDMASKRNINELSKQGIYM